MSNNKPIRRVAIKLANDANLVGSNGNIMMENDLG